MAAKGIDRLNARYYHDYVDEDERFRRVLARHLPVDGYVLDAGCGSGRFAHDLRDNSRGVIGVDLTKEISSNRSIDCAVMGDLEALPVASSSVSLCICKYVLEHLRRPAVFFSEVARVLEPDGVFIFHTPNRFHYVPLIAKLLPQSLHERINAARGRSETDTFPTFYRANSRGAVSRLARRCGLAVETIEMFESRPNYLVFSRATYLAGIAYERIVSASNLFCALRVNIIGVLRKPSSGSDKREN